MSTAKAKTRKIGRSAETGRFTTVEHARRNPKTHSVVTLRRRCS